MRARRIPLSLGSSPTDGPASILRGRTLQGGRGVGTDRVRLSFVVAVILATTLAGLGSGRDPRLVVAAVAGLALAVTVLVNVTAGLMVFLVVAFLESLPTIVGAPSIAKVVGLFLVLGWLAVVAVGRADDRSSLDFLNTSTPLACTLGLFLCWVLFSLVWAEDVGVARTTFFRYALNFVLFPIVFVAIRTPRHVVWLYSVFVAAALLVAAVGVQSSGGLSGGENRLEGAGLNPNQLGALLAVAAVLASVLSCYRVLSGPARLLALVSSGLCAVLVIMTGSRGALVGLIASLVITPFVVGRGRRLGAAALVVGGGVALAVWLTLVAPQALLQRLTQSGGGGSGRVDLWTIAFRMIHDRPLTGVGAGNFPVSSIHYLLQPGRITFDRFIIDQPKVTHNIYLQVLSELGVVGLILFSTVILLCIVSGFRAALAFRRQHDTDTELLTRGLLIALAGLLAADFFSSELYSKQLYILLAVAPALLAMAGRRARPTP